MRVGGWEERLLDVVERHRSLPFAWGISDCLRFALDAAEAVTGVDPYSDEKRYRTRVGAARRLTKRGFRNVEEALAAVYPQIPVVLAQRGDIGVTLVDGEPAAVVFIDNGAVGKGEVSGMVRIQRKAVTKAFAVR